MLMFEGSGLADRWDSFAPGRLATLRDKPKLRVELRTKEMIGVEFSGGQTGLELEKDR